MAEPKPALPAEDSVVCSVELLESSQHMRQEETVRIAAVGDIHCTKRSRGVLESLFEAAAQQADILILAGDLTDYGTVEEAHILAGEYANAGCPLPVVGVLGNHDHESGQPAAITEILCNAGIKILDGEAVEIDGIGFAGVKGFAGGFGRYTLGAWGETIIKNFVHEAIEEALKLEGALAKLHNPHRIAVLHYSPIAATVHGESPELFPFLGTTRLEEPLLRYPVSAVFHGHAHAGSPHGTTSNGIPVYNVAMPLLRTLNPEQAPLRIIEFSNSATAVAEDAIPEAASN